MGHNSERSAPAGTGRSGDPPKPRRSQTSNRAGADRLARHRQGPSRL